MEFVTETRCDMSYVIMAIQEEGSEIRISDFDEHDRGFDTREAAHKALDQVLDEDRYPEYRNMWVELLRDQAYYTEQFAREDYDGYDDYPEDY
jgi:hypothetical protein